MSGWLWSLIALWMIFAVIQLLVQLAPDSFWTNLFERHPNATCFLWGFTHLFGPRLQNTTWWPEAFEKKMRERGL